MKKFEWAIIGAGPAGLLTVGKLLDRGVDPKSIVWVDPEFKVGDLGKRWRNISSNTRVHLFHEFLKTCRSFQFDQAPDFSIQHLNPDQTCDLYHIVDPLQWISDRLVRAVETCKEMIVHIALYDRAWHLQSKSSLFSAKNVVLAIGSEPRVLPHVGPEMVPLREAMDPERVKTVCKKEDVVAVFGSSHSAILVLKNLVDLGVSRIVNFYRSPTRYAVQLDDWILFDDTGLKGNTADWAREHIDGNWPVALERVIASKEHLTEYLPECDKVVYAVGFDRRHLPVIAGIESVQYNAHSGIIAPGLFGIGIAFPECRINPIGIEEYAVGLWKFMDYIDRILPIWCKYGT